MSKKIIKRIYNVVIILLFLGAIGWCFSHFYHGSDVAYTDDAQVNRHITPINTRVPGFIKEIRFNDYQHVKKGEYTKSFCFVQNATAVKLILCKII